MALLILAGLLFVLLLVVLTAYVAKVHYVTNRLCEKIPILPGGHPVVGHTITVNNDLYQFCQYSAGQSNAMGGIVRTWFGTKPLFIVTEPELAKKLLHIYITKTYTYKFGEYWVGKGMFTAQGERWKRTRKLVNPAFNQKVLDGFIGVFNEQSRSLADEFGRHEGKGSCDFRDIVTRNSLESICQTMMGLSSDKTSVVSDKYLHSVDRLFEILNIRLKKIWLHLDFIYNMTDLKREETELADYVRLQTDKVIALRKSDTSKKEKTAEPNKKFKSYLDLMLEMQDHFTEREISDEVNTMIVAGYDTSATSVLMFFILIASHPQVQEKIYQELKEVFGDSNRDVVKEDFSKLVYLDATVKEFIRLYSVAPIIMREIEKPFEFDKGTLPKGSVILTNALGLNANERVWGRDAKEFVPERWLHANPPDYTSLLSFGYGRRSCIGKIFTLMSMKIYAAHLLRRYKLVGDMSKVQVHIETIIKVLAGGDLSVHRR